MRIFICAFECCVGGCGRWDGLGGLGRVGVCLSKCALLLLTTSCIKGYLYCNVLVFCIIYLLMAWLY